MVGVGPWGLAILERLIAVAGRRRAPVVLHVIEPGVPGAGNFSVDDPDYLPLNTPCGQHVMHPATVESDMPAYAQSLFAWARRRGYRWVGDECRITTEGRELSPNDFLPRRLMGEWLNWSYHALVAVCPGQVSVRHHATSAVDIEAVDGRELVHLADGRTLLVDQVILTTGHTPDHPRQGDESRPLSPYPVDNFRELIGPDDTVAIAGLGLVALDVVAALTVGLGGTFHECDGRLRYQGSGKEPKLFLFSRSGQPYFAKPTGASDPTGEYVPVICTPDAAARLRTSEDGRSARGAVDFCRDLLPLVTAEMQVRYYRQSAALFDEDPQAADKVTRALANAWAEGQFSAVVEEYARRYGAFDFQRHMFGEPSGQPSASADEYERSVYTTIEQDVTEALMEGAVSPVKAAYETLRVCRDTMRSVIEFQGLALDSYLEFQSSLSNRIKAVVAGPPVGRSRQLLALIDAGVVRIPWGPSPAVERAEGNAYVIRSTRLRQPYVRRVDFLVRGYQADPTVVRTQSPLISRLVDRGRIRPFRYGEIEVGSIDLTPESHPIGTDSKVQERIWVFGALTEGVRYFTQYVPSPKSRVRAFVDAEACAEHIFSMAEPDLAVGIPSLNGVDALQSVG